MFPITTANTGIVMMDIGKMIQSQLHSKAGLKINTNLFILYGKKDVVVRSEYTEMLYKKLLIDTSKYKKMIHVFPDALHEPIQDYEREEFVDLWSGFMKDVRKNYV